MTVNRWHNNTDPRLRNSGDTIDEHQRRVEVLCRSLARAIGYDVEWSYLPLAAGYHDEAERVLGDMPGPTKARYPILRWVNAAHEWWVLRQMGYRWHMTRRERLMLRLCDRLDAYQWAKRCGVTGPEWDDARREIGRMAVRLGADAVAWVGVQIK